MKTIRVKRLELPEATISRIFVPTLCLTEGTIKEAKFFGLELPNRANQPNKSCVPYGTYKAIVRMSPNKGYLVLQLVDVPNRSHCQFHIGNFTYQIEGCILLGDGIKDIDDNRIPDVINSNEAFNNFMHCVCDGLPEEGDACLVEFYK